MSRVLSGVVVFDPEYKASCGFSESRSVGVMNTNTLAIIVQVVLSLRSDDCRTKNFLLMIYI